MSKAQWSLATWYWLELSGYRQGQLLAETGEAMNCQDLIKGMADKGYWTSPGGLTPHATLYSAMARELKTKGAESRFRKVEKGKFSASKSA